MDIKNLFATAVFIFQFCPAAVNDSTSASIIDTTAFVAVHNFTQGIPHLNDNLIAKTLTVKPEVITAKIIQTTADNQGLF